MEENCVQLVDPQSGTTAQVMVSYGFNCVSLLAQMAGEPVELLWTAEDYAPGHPRPSGSGIPVLFPFPGRIQGPALNWKGKSYPLEADDGQGNAIHGLVHTRPWRIVEQSADRVIAEFQLSVDAPEQRDCWPADFLIRGEYQVAANSLVGRFTWSHPGRPGDPPLPCGFGLHPYFRMPLGGDQEEECLLQVPVSTVWELEGMNATGRCQKDPQAAQLATGLPLSDAQFDTVFSGLEFQEDQTCAASITDQAIAQRVNVRFSRPFRECVMYNPPHREAVCIEPYTCVPDCFRLHEQGVDAGMLLLEPGESTEAWISISLEAS